MNSWHPSFEQAAGLAVVCLVTSTVQLHLTNFKISKAGRARERNSCIQDL